VEVVRVGLVFVVDARIVAVFGGQVVDVVAVETPVSVVHEFGVDKPTFLPVHHVGLLEVFLARDMFVYQIHTLAVLIFSHFVETREPR